MVPSPDEWKLQKHEEQKGRVHEEQEERGNVDLWKLNWSLWSPQGSGGVPLTRKLCYAVGGVPYHMTTVAMGFSLQIFLLDVVQVRNQQHRVQ